MSDGPVTRLVPLAMIHGGGPVRGSEAEMNELMTSMKDQRQLQEVIVDASFRLIAGRRRVEAAKRLGWTTVRAFVDPSLADAVKALKAERDENGPRVALTREERLDLADRLLKLEQPDAHARKVGGLKKGAKIPVGAIGTHGKPAGKTANRVGEAVGMSGRTLSRAQAVTEAAKKDPDRYADLGKRVRSEDEPVEPIYQELRKRQEVYEAADADQAQFGDLAVHLLAGGDTKEIHTEYAKRAAEQERLETPVVDANGTAVPYALRAAWTDPYREDGLKAVEELRAGLMSLLDLFLAKAGQDPYFDVKAFKAAVGEANKTLYTLTGHIRASTPHAVCPKCGGAKCAKCKRTGWVVSAS